MDSAPLLVGGNTDFQTFIEIRGVVKCAGVMSME